MAEFIGSFQTGSHGEPLATHPLVIRHKFPDAHWRPVSTHPAENERKSVFPLGQSVILQPDKILEAFQRAIFGRPLTLFDSEKTRLCRP